MHFGKSGNRLSAVDLARIMFSSFLELDPRFHIQCPKRLTLVREERQKPDILSRDRCLAKCWIAFSL
jgi:hypothetical protein